MCGIVGYVGRRQAAPILIEGLGQLEYRGYDSAGVAVLGPSGAQVVRAVGRVRDLQAAMPKRFTGKIGIGHTRWATHGVPSERNAHPQSSPGRLRLRMRRPCSGRSSSGGPRSTSRSTPS